ncbi:hypothetical protein CHS0354_035265 [Potamilus streckersoni]|uniref:Sulfatase-modifying factor enzyme-like domain-containing protein n=1 Tax=Potamilus streckersoni TaxID=2493646 RepID=A0AAE0S2W6_9BIVA|nr:hypothetical protein CHS0354_035265 [Potamilus streckersoni]
MLTKSFSWTHGLFRELNKRLFWVLTVFLCLPGQAYTQEVNTLELAERISESLSRIKNTQLNTLAFNRVSGRMDDAVINELIDYTNVSVVRKGRFKVIDRSKMRQIIREQINNTSALISPEEYRRLGKLLGVDIFIYGRAYDDGLVLKAIEVETSAIIWADRFSLNGQKKPLPSYPYDDISGATANSIRKNTANLEKTGIRKISFWNFTGPLNRQKMIDHMSLALTGEGMQIIDRENLDIILEEQKLAMDSIIDEGQAKKIGALYGIDGFMYGSIQKKDGAYIASLKLMNILNGVIEWADLIITDDYAKPASSSVQDKQSVSQTENTQKDDMVLVPAGIALIGKGIAENTAFPPHQVRISAFHIDKYEVTNQAYADFVKKHNYRPPKGWASASPPPGQSMHPVVYVTWEDAQRFCQVQGKRLPTETEWEYAYRGDKNYDYPWGNTDSYRKDWSNHSEKRRI